MYHSLPDGCCFCLLQRRLQSEVLVLRRSIELLLLKRSISGKKSVKKSKIKKKKKRSEEEWAANATLVTCHRHYSRNRYRHYCPGDFVQDTRLLIRPQPGRSFNMFNFRSVDAVHWIIWHSVVNFQNVENRLIHAKATLMGSLSSSELYLNLKVSPGETVSIHSRSLSICFFRIFFHGRPQIGEVT